MLPNLKIGNLTAKYPIIQGGKGVGISLSSLAGAVAKAGGIGVISAAQPGWRDPEFARDPLSANLRALAFHIRRAKEISNGGIIGVNIMCALTHYEEYVRCCIETEPISSSPGPVSRPICQNTQREAPSSSPLSFPLPGLPRFF